MKSLNASVLYKEKFSAAFVELRREDRPKGLVELVGVVDMLPDWRGLELVEQMEPWEGDMLYSRIPSPTAGPAELASGGSAGHR
jgi:hypothetical protein